MTRELLVQNIMVNYKKYGVTEKMINDLIDSGIAAGQNYDGIYLGIKLALSKLYNEEFYCTSSEMAKAFGISEDEMDQLIEESRKELIATGKNPDEYFWTTPSTKFMM
jgi:hypothetical protein